MTSFRETLRLSLYEECLGPLGSLTCRDGTLIASIGEIQLALPAELEQSFRPLIGQRIAILRTDIPGKQYLFRVIPKESGSNQSNPESKPAIDGNGDTGLILNASTQEATMLKRTRGPESSYLPELENTPDSR